MNEVQEKVKNIIIKTFSLDGIEISMSTEFRGDLNVRQLDLITLVFAVEQEFGITINQLCTTCENLRTVSDLCSLVEKHLK